MKRSTARDAVQMWHAIQARDIDADGAFVYAVRTTGIYCRPSCPSRRPRRENVAIYSTPAEARAAGFRACKRCNPDSGSARPTDRRIERARQLIDRSEQGRIGLEELGRLVGMSPFHLQRRFKSAVGLTPSQYARARREERLRQELRKGERVSRAVYGSGFGSSSRVYEAVTARMGMTPGRYAKGGLGMNIRYTIVPSQLGRLLVGATDTGICAVSLGSDDMTLERELRNEFPRAELIRVDEGADRWLGNLVRQVEHSLSTPAGKPPAIPLDIMGTAFQYRVWQALQAIPAGETRTYTEVAQAIRRPKAVRAVARACASNRVAVVVPCHRVVRSDGTLGGYRWGVERKKRLLAAERASA